MAYPHVVINRKHPRTQQVMGHAMHLLAPFLKDGTEKYAYYALADFFDSQGVQLITEAHRIEAGLPSRDHNGMTLEELRIIEAKMIEGMSRPPPPMLIKCPKCNYQAEFTIGSHVAPVGDANEPRSSARDPLTIKPKNKSDWMR